MVSFIVPTYKDEAYLPACLASIAGQTAVTEYGEEIEIIVVRDENNLPFDHLPFGHLFDHLPFGHLLVLCQEHAGQSAARNRGLKAAKGEYIVFVDADDRLEPDWLKAHLDAMTDEVDYVQSGYKRIENGELGIENCELPRNKYQFTSPCMRLYRRKAIEGMRFEEGMIYEDILWSVDLWLRRLSCRKINNTGYLYTLNPHSTTSRRHPEAEEKLFKALRERAKKADLRGKMIICYTMMRARMHFLKESYR